MHRSNPQNAKPSKEKAAARKPQNAKPAASSGSRPPQQRKTAATKAPGNQGGFDVKIVPAPPQPKASAAAPGNEGGFGVRFVDPKGESVVNPTFSKEHGKDGGPHYSKASGSSVPIVKSNNRARPPAKQRRVSTVMIDSVNSWFGISDPMGAMKPSRLPSPAGNTEKSKSPRQPPKFAQSAAEGLREYRKFVLKEKEAKKTATRRVSSWEVLAYSKCEASSATIKKVSHESMVRAATGGQLIL